jgi:hypothetical protein
MPRRAHGLERRRTLQGGRAYRRRWIMTETERQILRFTPEGRGISLTATEHTTKGYGREEL